MRVNKYLANGLIGLTAVVAAAGSFTRAHDDAARPEATPAVSYLGAKVAEAATPKDGGGMKSATELRVDAALNALSANVTQQSDPRALESAFHAYFSYRAAHPDEVTKPYLYYVDYGLPSTTPRGYVFDMESLKLVDGPFTAAHGRGSSADRFGVPTRFSNASGSAATSLGLYVTKELYSFTGHTGGQAYSAAGMRLDGVSKGFNDLAYVRRVVAHGAPYVTPSRAGRSEGCPAMELARAARLLPKLANGSMVFLFAPNENWMKHDQWVAATDDGSATTASAATTADNS